jgi:CBS domain containing-hemolysin-like protein
MKAKLEVPLWINLFGWFVNIVLMLTILFFIVRYRRLQLQTLANQDLKGAIQKVLNLLDTFKKEFYLAVLILVSGIGLGFLVGATKGFESIHVNGNPSSLAIVIVALSMLVSFCLLIGSIFYIFHKGFNHLFGKYRDQLIQSLNELQENEE